MATRPGRKNEHEDAPRESPSQRKQAEDRFRLQVDGQTKATYSTVEAAEAAGLAIVRVRPVALRENAPPLLALYAMSRATDLPAALRTRPWVEPPLTIRLADGSVHPEYQAVKLAFGFPP